MIDILVSPPTLILPLNKDKESSEKGKKISISQGNLTLFRNFDWTYPSVIFQAYYILTEKKEKHFQFFESNNEN